MTSERIRVAVVFGGRSGEHPVSCISAAGVLANLDPDAFDVTAIGITPEGSWLQLDPAAIPVADRRRQLPDGRPTGSAVALPADPTAAALVLARPGRGVERRRWTSTWCSRCCTARTARTAPSRACWSWPACPTSGPGVLASAAAMDKEFTKKLLAAEGLPVGDWAVLRPGVPTLTGADRERLGLPVFVKPARAGSSLGRQPGRRLGRPGRAPSTHARQTDPKVLVEAAVLGREIECGVLEYPDGRVEASPTAEIHVGGEHDFYDFEAKYLDDARHLRHPGEAARRRRPRRIQELARRGVPRAGRAGPGPGRLLRHDRTATW